ncbi:helix-turn-helix transcriptional regulator [Streptomyces sp. SL13]|uniref:Helix-turn-helix transcriptional regulator n=1 Tax=Streptantibioticus silvisoli TaxID=2705255 RepID=A0AA90KJ97_9ACTN|nr:helix-turn-helix transcriptional regulator [Streptantibioticus silvisoli]MDI5973364.1 helix-turn-helix transcriptional regulator [Streptantibioticus silvisoli]
MTEPSAGDRTARNWTQPAFGARLKQLRVERGLSQGALAGDGMSAGYLSRLERGQRQPTPRAVAHLTARLGVPASVFDETVPTSQQHLQQLLATATGASELNGLETALTEAVESADVASPELRWQALWLLAEHAGRHGDTATELRHLRELCAVADSIGAPGLRSRAKSRLARCHRSLGEAEQALRYAADAAAIAREHHLPETELLPILLVLASAEAELGRLPEASALVQEILPLTERVPAALAAQALWASATVRGRQGDHTGAQSLLATALERLDSRDDLSLWMRLRLTVASLHLQSKPPRTAEAAAHLAQAEPALRLIGTELHRQQFLTLKAHLAFAEGAIDQARELCAEIDALDLRLTFRDRHRYAVLSSRVQILDGHVDEGVRRLRQLAQQAEDTFNMDLAAETWRLTAEALAPRS